MNDLGKILLCHFPPKDLFTNNMSINLEKMLTTINSNTYRTTRPNLNDIYLNGKIHATCMLRS